MFFLPQIPDAGTSAAAAGVATILTKLAADTLDFYISDVDLGGVADVPKVPQAEFIPIEEMVVADEPPYHK